MNQMDNWVDNLFKKQRWVIHIFFWLVILVIYAIFFAHKNSDYLQTFFLVGLLMPITIGTAYFLNYNLVPKYLMKGRYGKFILYFIYTLIASLYMQMLIVILIFIVLAGSKIHNMSPASINIFFVLVALLMVVFLTMGIKMLLHWRSSKDDYQKLMNEKVETELKFLKTQLHPHFLFNTLNNLYFLALDKSDQAPKAILALSELLDYVLHETKVKFVPLEKELKQVENYIALESLRYENRLAVTLSKKNITDKLIAPMILITIVENAFKHGVMKTNNKSWIELSVSAADNSTHIKVRNSIGNKNHSNNEDGIGLQNLRSQIDHIYKDQASLIIDHHEDSFCVELKLLNN
jgi:LytS/YehU family sensor histidine kinase